MKQGSLGIGQGIERLCKEWREGIHFAQFLHILAVEHPVVEPNLIYLYSIYCCTVVAAPNPEGFIRLDGGSQTILGNVLLLACTIDKNINTRSFA